MILFDVATALLTYVAGALDAAGRPVPARRVVSHGQPVHDVDCDGGQLAVWWESVDSSTAPNQGSSAGAKAIATRFPVGTTVVTFGVEVMRCVPVGTYVGREAWIPTAAAVTNAAEEPADDAWALHHALRVPKAALFGAHSSMCTVTQFDETTPYGPAGGVQGVVTAVVAQLDYGMVLP